MNPNKTPAFIDDIFDPPRHYTPEQRLCAAMISRAALDLNTYKEGHTDRILEEKQARASAVEWLLGKNPPRILSFVHCCQMLNMDPKRVRDSLDLIAEAVV
jgi:hypothetical protein